MAKEFMEHMLQDSNLFEDAVGASRERKSFNSTKIDL